EVKRPRRRRRCGRGRPRSESMSTVVDNEIREQKSLFGVITDTDEEVEIERSKPAVSLFDIEPQQGDADMQKLGLSDEPETETRKGFWRRQFQEEPTGMQRSFDWAFGVVLPVVCIFLDPVVFTNLIWETGAILGVYRPFAYAGSFISVILMM